MIDSVLYFPSIRVPESEWFTRVLLYWDTVGTIVPLEFMHDPDFLKPYTAGLTDVGLLQPVRPDRVWGGIGAWKYRESFLQLIDSLPLQKKGVPLESRKTVKIHVDKTGTGLAGSLKERGLADHLSGPDHDSWILVEKETADLFMGFIAAIIGQNRESRMVPITDSKKAAGAFTRLPVGSGATEAGLEPIRAELLADLLPAPVDPVKPRELATFKREHRKLLNHFRTEIEQRVIAAAAIKEPELRARQIELIRSGLKGEREEVSRRMQEKWRRIGYGGLLAVVAGGVLAADAALTGGALSKVGNSLGLTSAVWLAFDGARTPKDLLSNPLAYAAVAQKEFGRKAPRS